jgi:hypothetical protein
MELLSSAPLRLEGREAVLLLVNQTSRGIRFEKLVLAFGDDSGTVTITAAYPSATAGPLREPMRRALLSASWIGSGSVDLYGELPFEVMETPELKRVLRLSNSLGFSESGVSPVRSPREAFVIVTLSLQPVDLRDIEMYSKHRLQDLDVRDVRFRPGAEIRIGNRTGFELIADAVSKKEHTPLVLYQVLVPEGDGYLRLLAQVDAGRAAHFLPQFRRMALSLRPKEPR